MAYYFGIDTNTTSFPCPASTNFYIGQLGSGVSTSGANFKTTPAETAGFYQTYGYWTIEGPGSIPSGSNATEWGTAQADAFLEAWGTGTYSSYVGGETFFGDVESGSDGWSSGSQAQRTDIITAFLAEIVNVNPNYTAGLYANTNDWKNLIGNSWSSSTPFVWWLADTYTTITTCSDAETQWVDLISGGSLDRGGYKVMVWQYNGGSTDHDITIYPGYQSGKWNPVAS
jgi:hypothetical protein